MVCTTIIETGLDMPNVNTLIVTNADAMGLSQLYQLRGRVGRSSRLAYAYITYEKDRVLTEVAEKRLHAIKEFTEFGSGFKIAMRDLEIRGAGNLLGPNSMDIWHRLAMTSIAKCWRKPSIVPREFPKRFKGRLLWSSRWMPSFPIGIYQRRVKESKCIKK